MNNGEPVKIEPIKSTVREATPDDLQGTANKTSGDGGESAIQSESKPAAQTGSKNTARPKSKNGTGRKRGRPPKKQTDAKQPAQAVSDESKEREQIVQGLTLIFNVIIGERSPKWKLAPHEINALAEVTPPFLKDLGISLDNLGPKANFAIVAVPIFGPKIVDSFQNWMKNRSVKSFVDSAKPRNLLNRFKGKLNGAQES